MKVFSECTFVFVFVFVFVVFFLRVPASDHLVEFVLLFVPIPNGPLFLKVRFSFATYYIFNMSVFSKGDVFDKDFM